MSKREPGEDKPRPAHLEERGIDLATALDVVQTGAAVVGTYAAVKATSKPKDPPRPKPDK